MTKDWADDKAYDVTLNKDSTCRYGMFGSTVQYDNGQKLFRIRIEDNATGDFMWMDMTPEQVEHFMVQMGKFVNENR